MRRAFFLVSFLLLGAAQAAPPDADAYRAARDDLARGAYRRAAAGLADLVARHPDSKLVGEALYWEAFALFKTGGMDEMHAAKRVLAVLQARVPDSDTRDAAQVLDLRVCGELARRGHLGCAEQIATAARQPCGAGPDDQLIAALDALEDLNSTAMMPALRTVLGRQDICSEHVRKRAVLLMAEQEPEASVDILLDVIREDPSSDVRLQAVTLLPDLQSPRVAGVLDSLVQTTGDADLRDRALVGIAESGPGGRRILRRIVERRDAGEEVRAAAIAGLGRAGDNAEDSGFLRGVYARLETPHLKQRAIEALGEMPSTPTRRWLLDLALAGHEPLELRRLALFYAGQTGDAGEIAAHYDRLHEPALREQAIAVLGSRGGRAAAAKLADLAQHEPDAALRAKAAFWLAQLDEPAP